jgi:hypothetical protein
MSRAFLAKKRNLDLSKALTREHLAQIGVKASRVPDHNPRLKPLADALKSAMSAKTPGLSRRLIKTLAGE